MTSPPGASPALEPLAGEIFSLAHLADHARELAAEHAAAAATGPLRPLLDEFRRTRDDLLAAYREIESAARADGTHTEPAPAEEWLLDNFHVVEEQFREIVEDLPRGYLVQLPRLAEGPSAGYPRVYLLALDLISHTDARLDQENLLHYVKAYQERAPLTIGELWAVPIMLRLGLVDNLLPPARQELLARAERALADRWADRILTRARERSSHGVVALAELAVSQHQFTDGFVSQLVKRLRDEHLALGPVFAWVEDRLSEAETTVEDVTRRERHRQATNQVSVGNSITSMRLIGTLDWSAFFEQVSLVELELRRDPAQAYAAMDSPSRDSYRRAVEVLARRSGIAEQEVARRAVDRAGGQTDTAPSNDRRRHIGYYLVDDGRIELESELGYRTPFMESLRRTILAHPLPIYLGANAVLTAVLVAIALILAWLAEGNVGLLLLTALLVVLPASEMAVSLVNLDICSFLRPRVLPKLLLDEGIPETCRTVVVVPTMLASADGVRELVADLEIRYLANQDPNLHFALLTDFADAECEELPDDAALLGLARSEIEALDQRHAAGRADRFFLFHRRRRWNPGQGVWMGWERKRGKLEEFNRVLRGAPDASFAWVVGDVAALRDVRYVITLDTDTQLPRDAARRLVGTIAHPLNRACFDPARGRVVEGYGLVQPRVSTNLVSAGRSLFSRVFTGNTGLDPYTTAVSDVYQDLFGEGSYYGKGIYDVDAFSAALAGRVPENHLLSHDLFEGVFVRVALASDVELLDEYPSSYAVYASRQHRWIRGDWQLIPWLAPSVPAVGGTRPNDVPPLGRWKLFDNLRRSLLAPSILTLLLAGWTILPGPSGLWTAIAVSAIAFSIFSHVATTLVRADGGAWTSYLRGFWGDLRTNLLQVLITIAVLPDQAVLALDAIARTLARVLATHRGLLQWETAAEAERRAARGVGDLWRTMWTGPVVGAVAAILVVAVRPSALPLALPFAIAWLALPVVADRISRPTEPRKRPLTPDEVRLLRRTARKTWRFFEAFVTEDDHWLPPDNYQEDPRGILARRTSPTNIGLYLLSVLAARDFGYLTMSEVAKRLEDTLGTLQRMAPYRGHLYNWYDTATLQPLQPLYVSTVDSGNLVGSLLALKQGLDEILREPILGPELLEALGDALGLQGEVAGHGQGRSNGEVRNAFPGSDRTPDPRGVEILTAALAQAAEQPPSDVAGWRALLDDLLRIAEPLAPERLEVAPVIPESFFWIERVIALLRATCDELDALVPTSDAPRAGVPSLCQLATSSGAAAELVGRVERLVDAAEAFARDTDFRLVFDPSRRLFSIGFNVVSGQLDNSSYDLLASEARLASLVAIALDQIPQGHWFRLGRQLAPVRGGRALLSWSGTMFEYLMPLLLTRRYPHTLLDETYASVVDHQIAYGARRQVPWGISESAYNILDLALNYQYRAFGVPGLGLQPGLGADLVVAPYATFLALLVAPETAVANLRALAREGMEGQFGFYESLDYTPIRVPPGRKAVVVQAFMAHHQGMSLVALDNAVHGDPMVRRFHAEPRIRATELLLQERTPGPVELFKLRTQEDGRDPEITVADQESAERVARLDGPIPSTLLLSNGKYSVVLTAAGAGASTYLDLAVTRWREDTTLDEGGSFCYVRTTIDEQSSTGKMASPSAPSCWSTTFSPTRLRPDEYSVVYTPEASRFRRRDGDIETITEVAVSPENDAEVRRVSLANLGQETVRLDVTSFAEIALAPRMADLAHPAFGNLFIETEFDDETGALLCSRRPRSESEQRVWLVHVSAVEGRVAPLSEYETSRARFVGRTRDPASPAALVPGARLSNTVGAVLDPVVSLRRMVTLTPGDRAVVSFTTGVAESREAALELADKFGDPRAISRTFELAWTDSRVELRHLNLTAEQALRFQELASSLIFHDPARRAETEVLARNTRNQPHLWAYGISGDRPILLVRVDDPTSTELVGELLLAHEYWRLQGLSVDLVILNEDPGGYLQPLQDALLAMVQGSPAHAHLDHPGGVFLRRSDLVLEEDRVLLMAVARVVLLSSRGRLVRQLARQRREPRAASREVDVQSVEPGPSSPPPATDNPPLVGDDSRLSFHNGRGGFTPDGSEYVIELGPSETTPAPWINVIANPDFGFLVSESGSGFTWQGNSQANRLTPWSNDPVSDPAGEALYLRDEDSGQVWSPTPLPSPSGQPFRVRHGQGVTRFEHAAFGIETELELFVPPEDPVKIRLLRLRNRSGRPRRLTATFYAEWVLGSVRERAAPHVQSEHDAEHGALFAHNRYVDPAGRVAFVATSVPPTAFTADRTEFLGRNGDRARPDALIRGALSGRVGPGLDPCGAIQVSVELDVDETRELVFLLGQGRDVEHVRSLIRAHRAPADAHASLDAARARWDRILGTVQVRTPDPALDLLVNRWLLYQNLGCRFWARSAFYQSGGAYGFRDQLQDVMALLFAAPELAREQILRAAARQFLEGDVQHWWHPETGQGVRTRCSDDLLWLPYVTAAYVAATGDQALLDESVPFLESPPLKPDESEQFGIPRVSETHATLYEHCLRALDRGMTSGPHGLPLIGDGDWNDGMNRVGHEGRGESVWVAWFLASVLTRFTPLCESRGDSERATRFRAEVGRLGEAIEQHAWDGAWYRRAYFDDGTPLGSASNDECKIDAIAQAWSVISGLGDPTRARTAMRSLEQHLVRAADGLILLLTPPFDRMAHDPGYIKGYLPGVRENGGQYTHGALWTVLATALLGDGDRAVELFGLLNPINHASTPDGVERYRVEPYVVAADVYAAPQHLGRGGWTWYTGSAGWMYRVAVEAILGLCLEAGHIRVDPTIPRSWTGFELRYRRGETLYTITVENPDGVNRGVRQVQLDGTPVPDARIPLSNDGREHHVRVTLGPSRD